MNSTLPPTSSSGTTLGRIGLFVGIGCLVCILLSVGLTIAGISAINPLVKSWFGIDMDPTVEPPGDIHAYDPISEYTEIKTYAGNDTQLTELSATYVRSDGTLDLTANLSPSPHVKYVFAKKLTPEGDAPPIGAGVGTDGHQWQTVTVDVGNPGKRTQVRRLGGNVSAQYSYVNRGMIKNEGTPTGSNSRTVLTDPTCSFADLWKIALERGAPKEALAIITYDADGYDFTIRDTDVRMTFGNTCALTSFKGEEISERGKPIVDLSSVSAEKLIQEELTRRGISISEGGLPPVRFVTRRGENGTWYVARQTEGSGVAGIFSALCFKIESDQTVTDIGTYTHASDTPMIQTLDLTTCSPQTR